MSHKMNKTVIHNGKSYEKDSIISKEKHGNDFDVLVKAGHAFDPMAGAKAALAEDKSDVEVQSVSKSKK